MIGQIFLKINLFEADGVLRRLEALAKLRHVEHIMHICKVGGKLKLIGEIASFANDLERTDVSRGTFPFDTEVTSAFHWRDAEVDMVSDLECQITVFAIVIALLTRLSGFEILTNDFTHIFILYDQVVAKKLAFARL